MSKSTTAERSKNPTTEPAETQSQQLNDVIADTSNQLAFDGMQREADNAQGIENSESTPPSEVSPSGVPPSEVSPSEVFRCEGCFKIEVPVVDVQPENVSEIENFSHPDGWHSRHFCSPDCWEKYQTRQLKKLGIGHRFLHASFEGFHVVEKNRRAYEKCVKGAQNLDKGIFLYGSVGAGKTHLMIAMIREMIERRVATFDEINFVPILELLERVKASWESGQRSPIDALKRVPVLFIDDLGMEVVKDWAFQIFLNILTYRYNEDLPIYMSSNLTHDELLDRYGNAVFSRLAQMCELVEIDSDDYRLGGY